MVMAVWFAQYGRLHYLDAGDLDAQVGDKVLVPTDDGPEVAECVWAPQYVSDTVDGLPACAGRASEADVRRDEANRAIRARARVTARRLIRQHELPMKVLGVDYLDRRPDVDRLVRIWFSAPGRVDFRALVRELARSLHARIDLRQVGPREEARLVGGIGSCGRELCCSTFLKDFEPVSVRMAHTQQLPNNPLRISGACGRLMCCLKYEHPLYEDFAASAPGIGCAVDTPEGAGTVVDHKVPADQVVVRLDGSGAVSACNRADTCASRAAHDDAYGSGGTGRRSTRRTGRTDRGTEA